MTLLAVVLMILSALVIALPGMQGREYGMNPAATSSSNIQPNPTLNTNVTWSTFTDGWTPLEYSNGSANLTLNAEPSVFYANYITVDPADIQANHTLTNDKLGTMTTTWENTTWQATGSTGEGSYETDTIQTYGSLTVKANTSSTTAETSGYYITVPLSDFPSNNLQYDYLTGILTFSGAQISGVSATMKISNQTSVDQYVTITPGQSVYFSASLAQIQQKDNYAATFNTSGKGATTLVSIEPSMSLPTYTTTEDYTLTLSGLAFTDYALTLGQNATGATVTESGNHAQLSALSPDFKWTSITNNGYTVAVSQSLQNLTEQQSAINSGSYIEQVEYQGQFVLPTAPDLSYGPANITEHFNVNTSQTQVLDINGVSYLSAISGKNNTIQLLSSVNPNSQTQFLQIVDYTQSQWTSISSPPGIFTLAGIEYYWEEFIIAILAVVGVGAGAASRHASNLRKVK